MADVQPFRAVRYARPTATVTAPPYDIVTPARLAELRASDPHNVVQLTLGTSEEDSGRLYHTWLEQGVLVRDASPAVWVLEQDYQHPDGDLRTVRGLVASLAAEPYDAGVVLRHERTHQAPREGRLRLLRAARAQLEPILVLHEDPPPLVIPSGPPDLEGQGTRLWRREDAAELTAWFAPRQVLIADGHHRYEAALALAAEPGEGATARVLAVLVAADDPGLGLVATHRVAPTLADPGSHPLRTVADAYLVLLDSSYGAAAAVACTSEGAWVVRGDDGELDTELVERLAGTDGLIYTPDRGSALARVAEGDVTAYLLRPPRAADVFERARVGHPMPQKSTYFLPKLISGLIFHPV